MIGRNDECWCGSRKKWKKCHYPQQNHKKDLNLKELYFKKHHIRIKDNIQIQGIKKACQLASQILEETCKCAKEGISTQQLNDFAHQLHLDAGAIPACLNYGYPPFPKSICTSINEVICHGIPDQIFLKNGDILNIDITCILNGYYGDCSKMVIIGNRTTTDRQLVVDVAYECLMDSVAILKPGVLVSEVGNVIEKCASSKGCSVVNQFVGHGVGLEFHEGPQVPHCYNSTNIPFIPGMTFTIEPMINAGMRDALIDPYDNWTARTSDGKPSAQWEHTILITDEGHEILTTWKRR